MLRNPKLILTFLIFILAALLGTLILGIYRIKAVNQEVSESINKIDRIEKGRILTQSLRAIRTDAEDDIVMFEEFVLTEERLVSLIENLESTGRTLGLETEILSVGKVEDKKSEEDLPIRIAIETRGSWNGAFNFLRAVENLPYLVIMEEVDFSKVENIWHLKTVILLQTFD